MEEQEDKKTRDIHRATQDDDDRCQVDHIPLDLTLEILSRLPTKSIARFLCVSKLWSSFTTTLPSFINSFARVSVLFTASPSSAHLHTTREALRFLLSSKPE
ncbi:hypothetical protein N665_1305s0004 [Sinapis alba]|nr:hypothetical protein N665_1305s0004 [Sinapis alba]